LELHFLLQYRTCSQFKIHLRRQVKLRPQVGQILVGRKGFR
jgi:hypothetical protein